MYVELEAVGVHFDQIDQFSALFMLGMPAPLTRAQVTQKLLLILCIPRHEEWAHCCCGLVICMCKFMAHIKTHIVSRKLFKPTAPTAVLFPVLLCHHRCL